MTNFFFGLLVGSFLGALVMFVFLGIICFSLEKRREKSILAKQRAAREIHGDPEALSSSPTKGPQIPPVLSLWRNRGPLCLDRHKPRQD